MKRVIITLALAAGCLLAQDPVAVTPYQVLDSRNGAVIPCSGCQIFTYEAGTSTPQAVYTDSTLDTPNTNPVLTNSAGYVVDGSTITGIWVGNACYKFVLEDASNVVIWTQDHICDQLQVFKALLATSSGAGLIGYEYPDGALRTVQNRLQDRVSVLDFAVGGTVNTAAFQNALNSGAGVVWVPPMTASIGALTVPTGTTLLCAGPTETVITYGGGSTFIAPAVAALNQQLSVQNCGITMSSGGTAIKMTGVWSSEISGNVISGATVGIDMDGTSYGTYENVIANNSFPTGVQNIKCTGGSGQGCNHNHILYNYSATFSGTVGYECDASVCEYNQWIGNNLTAPTGGMTVTFFSIAGDNNYLSNNTCDATLASGDTWTCIDLTGGGGGNQVYADKDSLNSMAGGTAIFVGATASTTKGAQVIQELSTGNSPIYYWGDVVGAASLTIASVSSGPNVRLQNLTVCAASTNMSGEWGWNAYSDGHMYLQSLGCSNPGVIPSTNFNALNIDTSGGLTLYQNLHMPSGGIIYDSQYLSQTGSSSNNDIEGQLTSGSTYSFTGSYVTAPICIVSATAAGETTPIPSGVISGSGPTSWVLTANGTTSHTYNYYCHGRT